MKKFFTMLGAALMLGNVTANAESITVYVQDYNGNTLASPFETELTKDVDGNYIMADFFNSYTPLKFTFSNPEVGASSNIVFTGKLDTSDTYPYLLDDDGYYPTCAAWGLNGVEDWTYIYWPYVAADGYSWVYRYDMSDSNNVYEYYGSICMNGTLMENPDDETGTALGWTYLNFYFNEPVVTDPSEAEGQPITVWTSYWDNEAGEAVELMDYETELTKNADGSYTIKDFLNSGCPASFTYEKDSSSFMKAIHMCNNIWNDPDRPGYPFLMTSSDFTIGSEGYPVNLSDYMICYAYSEEDVATAIYQTFVDETSNYASYVMVLNPDCTAFITVSGADKDGNELPEYYLQFEFNESLFNSSIKNIEDNSNAPIEYYNLNGMRVNDPSNGIFIRKQGSNAQKVIFK